MATATDEDSRGSSPGNCPDCDAALLGADVLIQYETRTGQERLFAECPDCRSVVHPV
jgi:hypothetical protein